MSNNDNNNNLVINHHHMVILNSLLKRHMFRSETIVAKRNSKTSFVYLIMFKRKSLLSFNQFQVDIIVEIIISIKVLKNDNNDNFEIKHYGMAILW